MTIKKMNSRDDDLDAESHICRLIREIEDHVTERIKRDLAKYQRLIFTVKFIDVFVLIDRNGRRCSLSGIYWADVGRSRLYQP